MFSLRTRDPGEALIKARRYVVILDGLFRPAGQANKTIDFDRFFSTESKKQIMPDEMVPTTTTITPEDIQTLQRAGLPAEKIQAMAEQAYVSVKLACPVI